MGATVTPTARTLKALQAKGFHCAVVEKWVPLHGGKEDAEPGEGALFSASYRKGPAGYRKDAFGFIDILVLDGMPGCLAVQACGATGFADHLRKIDAIEEVRNWLVAGNRLELWSWRKVAEDGKERWRPKIAPLAIDETGHITTVYELAARRTA